MGSNNVLLRAADIDRIVHRMAQEIRERHDGTDTLVLVGIHTRGVHLARRLQEKIQEAAGVPIPSGSIDITLYRDDWTRISQHPAVKATDILFSVDRKRVVLVDDVLFTGRTTRAAMDALIDVGRPDRIELAVLVDRGHRELPIHPDYVGAVVKTGRTDTVNVFLKEQDGADKVELS